MGLVQGALVAVEDAERLVYKTNAEKEGDLRKGQKQNG